MSIEDGHQTRPGDWVDVVVRLFSWSMLAAVGVFLLNNVLMLGLGWPGIAPLFLGNAAGTLSWIQMLAYLAGILAAAVYVLYSPGRSLRSDGFLISDINTFLVRAAFWIVLLVCKGLVWFMLRPEPPPIEGP